MRTWHKFYKFFTSATSKEILEKSTTAQTQTSMISYPFYQFIHYKSTRFLTPGNIDLTRLLRVGYMSLDDLTQWKYTNIDDVTRTSILVTRI